jgi:hypothetical protein
MRRWRRSSLTVPIGLALSVFAAPRDAEAKWPPGYVPQVRTWFSYGVRYSHPQKASVSFTLMRATETDTMMVAGWFVQAEPGLGGGKASVGFGALSPSDRAWVPPIFGAGLKASLMRTWGSPDGVLPDQTLLGPELDFTLPFLKLTAGYLWRVGGDGEGAGHFTWGVGVGF